VRGGDDDGARVRAVELLDAEAVVVDTDRHQLEAGAEGNQTLLGMAGILDRDPPDPARSECPADETLALCVAVRDDDSGRVREHAADATEVLRERGAQRHNPTRVAVVEVRVRHRRESPPDGAEPGIPWKGGGVRHAGAEVEPRQPRGRFRGRGRSRRRGGRRDRRRRALAGGEIALGAELPVRVHDDAAPDAELLCQVAGGGQTRPRPERSRSDRLPQLILDLRNERHQPVSAQREQELHRLVSFDTHGLDLPVGPVRVYSRRIESRRS
jgi:hypothetical protein